MFTRLGARTYLRLVIASAWLAVWASASRSSAAEEPAGAVDPVARFAALFCVDCHNPDDRAGGLDLEAADTGDVLRRPDDWEKVVRRLASRQMPPADALRPKERDYRAILAALETPLDRAAAERPNAGRTETFRRLTRTEYQNAVRDLLDLDVDAAALLPNDESSRGFDNITVGDLSPTLLDRYIGAAQKISRLAIGAAGRSPDGETFRIPADVTQEGHVEGLPLGTRGGTLIRYTFPQDGEYDVQVLLTRDRDEHLEGLHEPHELVVLLDRARVATLPVTPPKTDSDHQTIDANLKVRFPAKAGPHELGVTFLKKGASLQEFKRRPYQAHFNVHRHPRTAPAVYQVSITGPYDPKGPGDTPSRRRIFVQTPESPDDEDACARRIVSELARRAYRRPVDEADLRGPMRLYQEARAEGGFESGVEAALAGILVNPHFLFRIEADPPGVEPKAAYRLDDIQLASRLSFFLWSSIPDDELLGLAERGALGDKEILDRQVRRMLADPRSRSLATNFAGQWLHLRNLDSITPDLRLFPDFDDNLRQAFRRETEMAFEAVHREDRNVLELLKTDRAFLNERLARHYGVPNVLGDRFRAVTLGADAPRGGLLRQGSVLTVSSYATRTSPVIRGKWVLENILGTPPPPPPPDIPALQDAPLDSHLTVRDRLALHRADVACVGCHKLTDPVGFALENYDAVGRWRDAEAGAPVDATGGLPDGTALTGVDGLEAALLKRPEVFATTLTEKLLTFALGRGVEPFDGPAVRKIVRDARASGWRFSAFIAGIAASTPFQMRNSE